VSAELQVVPGLGGATSQVIPVATSAWLIRSTEPPSITTQLGGPDRTQVLERLAQLREAAAQRQRTMPNVPDSREQQREIADHTAALQDLQAQTAQWRQEDQED
jgi:hypothetical protein